jgi:hypothetical protein
MRATVTRLCGLGAPFFVFMDTRLYSRAKLRAKVTH